MSAGGYPLSKRMNSCLMLTDKGGLSATSLATLADDGASVALRWLDMVPPTPVSTPANTDGTTSGTFAVKVIKETNDFVGLIKDPINFVSIMGPARSGKSIYTSNICGITAAYRKQVP